MVLHGLLTRMVQFVLVRVWSARAMLMCLRPGVIMPVVVAYLLRVVEVHVGVPEAVLVSMVTHSGPITFEAMSTHFLHFSGDSPFICS